MSNLILLSLGFLISNSGLVIPSTCGFPKDCLDKGIGLHDQGQIIVQNNECILPISLFLYFSPSSFNIVGICLVLDILSLITILL